MMREDARQDAILSVMRRARPIDVSRAPSAPRRRHKAPEGECRTCDKMRCEGNDFHPPHDASPRCESGGHNHCSCDTCF